MGKHDVQLSFNIYVVGDTNNVYYYQWIFNDITSVAEDEGYKQHTYEYEISVCFCAGRT